ncbi:lipid droplet assembly factor 1-A-like [Haliotis asinina]|uniref:lipid droplet assembly factor 1-A-like n=1 Tax=Haliotis asinina TaxID=109174 RepID=UPI003531E0EA
MSGFGEKEEEDISSLICSLNEYLEVDRRVSEVKMYAHQHPVMTLFWVVTLAMCCVPVICFCTFVCASIFLAIAGFVLIEGTVVTIATVLLGGALLGCCLLALGFSSSLVVGFYAIQYSLDMVKGLTNKMQKPRSGPAVIQHSPPAETPQRRVEPFVSHKR